MSGIVFHKTKDLPRLVTFYTDKIGAEIWLEQGGCTLLRHGNFIFGFCSGEETDSCGVLTFFYETRTQVIEMYELLQDVALNAPKETPQYCIFNFFAHDPDGRTIEFQVFNHRLNPYLSGDELLITRRSLRAFTDEVVSEETLHKVFELCRYSPTSSNTQAFYFIITRNDKLKNQLADLKQAGGNPLRNAPLAAAVCTDSSKTIRAEEDGCIAAAYLLLAAAQHGLGTCWIGGMNTPEVKKLLSIPENHYIACLTPIGYPLAPPVDIPERRPVSRFVREI